MRISDWSSDVCSSDLAAAFPRPPWEHRMSPSRWLAPLFFALAMLPFAAAAAESDEEAFRCLALAIYWEARSEGRDGMTAIGAVEIGRAQCRERVSPDV